MHWKPDEAFTFLLHPRWKFWKRRVGVAEVIATDDELGVVHLRVVGAGPSVIAHLPILERQVTRNSSSRSSGAPSKDSVCRNAVAAWRLEHDRDVAGVFSIPLAEAVSAIHSTARELTEDVFIETTYPVRDETGTFRTVRVVTAPRRRTVEP